MADNDKQIVEQTKVKVGEFHKLCESVAQASSRHEARLEVFSDQFNKFCAKYGITTDFHNLQEVQKFLEERSKTLGVSVNKNNETIQAILEAARANDWVKVGQLVGISEQTETPAEPEPEPAPAVATEPEPEVEDEAGDAAIPPVEPEPDPAPAGFAGNVGFAGDDAGFATADGGVEPPEQTVQPTVQPTGLKVVEIPPLADPISSPNQPVAPAPQPVQQPAPKPATAKKRMINFFDDDEVAPEPQPAPAKKPISFSDDTDTAAPAKKPVSFYDDVKPQPQTEPETPDDDGSESGQTW